ncbi:retrotransposon gag protein [Cucumis melo var. makuwa]|uniref:Retrotransposon gag protein n=1 Tax=Cucumis melo var. makuwa TaxID=1194695 RepID=A0A5D3DS25_CUCMM|nr:retrotransposon gag protein [Cucumis melo var. makuwa]
MMVMKSVTQLLKKCKKKYPFPNSDVADMLEQLLENQLIQLPEYKRPKQTGKVDDHKYCKYHRVISHPIEKCVVLKELILKLAREKKIEMDIDEVAQTNHVVVEMTSSVPPSTQFYDQRKRLNSIWDFRTYSCPIPTKDRDDRLPKQRRAC